MTTLPSSSTITNGTSEVAAAGRVAVDADTDTELPHDCVPPSEPNHPNAGSPAQYWPAPLPIELACGPVTLRVAVGTDVSYVAELATQLLTRLAQNVASPIPASTPLTDTLHQMHVAQETHERIRAFLASIETGVPTAEQLAVLLRWDLQAQLSFREMLENLENAMMEPRVAVQDDPLERAQLEQLWAFLDENSSHRARTEALIGAIRTALAAVAAELDNARAVR